MFDSDGNGKPMVLALSLTWLQSKHAVVRVIFEAIPMMRSQVGADQEMAAFESAARTICSSIE